jgi:hypothetical protein
MMKKIVQIFPHEHDEAFLRGWKRWSDQLIELDSWDKINSEIPLVIPANLVDKNHREWLKLRRPSFVINRQLTGGWKEKHRSMFRVAVNSYAATKIGNISHSRYPILNIEKHPWKVRKIRNVLIAPPLKSICFWTGMTAMEWAEQIKTKLEGEGANIRIREKQRKRWTRYTTLWEDFDWADLVVSYSSGITAEALWYGKQAISLGVCPTWVACDNTLDNWHNATEPTNRDIYHEHLAWIQFKFDEWESGVAQELTVAYQGWPTEVQVPDNPIVTD